jgi:hypothetical protein
MRSGMDDELIELNCGRCGRRLTMTIEDLGDKRTLECRGADIGCLAVKVAHPVPTRRYVAVADERRTP